MNLLLALIIGAVVGLAAAVAADRPNEYVASVILGILGSLIAGIFAYLLNASGAGYFIFSWAGLFWSFVGALLLAGIANLTHVYPHRHL